MKWTITALLGFIFTFGATANAMPIVSFNKMASNDQAKYLTMLIKGSVEALEGRGNKHDADKLYNLFRTEGGRQQLIKNLDILEAADKKNAANPDNKQPPYEVEQAFALTLKDNGIIVPLNFLLTINKDFKPTSPLK